MPAWTSGAERTWKSLSEWVNTPAANWHDCILPFTGRHSGVSARVQRHPYMHITLVTTLTKLLTWLILCQASSWLALNQTYSDCQNTDRTKQSISQHSSLSAFAHSVIELYTVCILHSILYACVLVSTDLAVRWDSRNCHMLSCGSRVQKGDALHVSRGNRTDHQQKQPAPGRSVDGWIQKLLLYHLSWWVGTCVRVCADVRACVLVCMCSCWYACMCSCGEVNLCGRCDLSINPVTVWYCSCDPAVQDGGCGE